MTRFETLLHVQEDGSFKGRIMIAQDSWQTVFGNPIGFGIGSSGLAQRLNGYAQNVVSDNGWLELAGSLGLPGLMLLIGGLALIWRYSSLLMHLGLQDDYLGLGRTFLIALLIFMWAGNFFIDFSLLWIALGRVLSPVVLEKMELQVKEIQENRTAEATS
jgi:hypothetical protein